MFRCQRCKQVTRPGTACCLVTTQKRTRYYSERTKVHPAKRIILGKKKKVLIDDPGGQGWEIAVELKMCPDCAVKYESDQKRATVSR